MDSPKNSDESCAWRKNSNSFEELSSGLDHKATSPVTPKSDRLPVASNFDNGSPDVSDSSYSELDSEAEAFYSSLNYHLVSPGAMDTHDLAEKHLSYGELMKRFLQCEEELKTTSTKLQESEQEIEKLKGETEKRDSAENLRAELETARKEIETRDIDIETEKRRVLELQTQIVDLETKLSDSSFKIEDLVIQLEVSRVCLDVSVAETSTLREQLCDCQQSFSTEKSMLQADLLEKQTFFEARVKEMESRIEVLEDQIRHSDAAELEMQRKEVELQAEINALTTDLDSRGEHIDIEALDKEFGKHKLRYHMVSKEIDGLCAGLDNLQTDLLEKQTFFEARVREFESRIEVLEDQIRHSDAAELEMQRKEVELQAEINALKTDLESRSDHIEALNKEFDKHKLRYDMLMAEKDGICAELDNLKAEMRSKDIQIKQMEEQLNHLHHKNTELVSESGNGEELRAMVKELERQVELQRNAIAEGKEEKREAIRQLCFSLDHYKSRYRQLLQLLSSNTKQQQAIMIV